jgi:hypothetical protein
MATLPVRDTKHVTAEQAINILKRTLPKEWICREQTSDYGIDVEIEIADSHATGWIFKGQVKGHQQIVWNADGTWLQQVRPETLAYWRGMRVPVVLFAVDVGSEALFWSPGQGATAEATGIRISKSRQLPQSQRDLEWHLATWIDDEASRRYLLSLPRIAKRLAHRRQQMNYDAHMSIEDDEFEDLAALYEDVVSLRKAVGLPFADLFPWSLWLARVRRVFGPQAEHMYWGIHDEIVLYLNPFADEAIARAKEVLSAQEATPENAQAKAFTDNYRTQWMFKSEFDDADETFWSRVQAVLEKQGACLCTRTPPEPA